MIRDYDEALVAKLGAADAVGPDTVTRKYTSVLGMAAPVVVAFSLPEEWYLTYTLPAINVSRMGPVAAPRRLLPGYRHSVIEDGLSKTQTLPPTPVDLMYTVELAAESQSEMNLLLEHLMTRLPAFGYGSFVTVNTRQIAFRQIDSYDRTDYTENREGRKFIVQFTYVLEGWFSAADNCTTVEPIHTVSTDLESHKTATELSNETPQSDAEYVTTIINQ